MASSKPSAQQGADQAGVPPARPAQMQASEPRPTKPPVQAAFGTSGGAAVVFRDYASI